MTARACRSCGYATLHPVLDLGRTPLANQLLALSQLDRPEAFYPLEVVLCPRCTLVQITETVPPEQLFREYPYFSSFSDTLLQHAEELANSLVDARSLDGRSEVVELASNDGYLLQYYKRRGVRVLGIEPARNIARVAEERGIPTICEFFDAGLALQLREQDHRADVLHAHNVLAHVADLNGFVEGIHVLLKEDGLAVVETPYIKDLIDHCEFDTIYHEHLCYYSLTALDDLFRRHGMLVQDVARIPIHGGSLRVLVGQAGAFVPTAAVTSLLAEEAAWGVGRLEFYQCFSEGVSHLKECLRAMLSDLKQRGNHIAAYGAAAKGSTLLNYCLIGSDLLDFVVDRSTYKQGHYMPGVHLPICSPQRLLDDMPDYTLLLTWNFAPEIVQQQSDYIRRGGRFIVPIPRLEVVDTDWLAQAHAESSYAL